MSDNKSKVPSLEEFGKYANKLFTDVKASIKDIIKTYQEDRQCEEEAVQDAPNEKKSTSAAPVKKTTQQNADNKADVQKPAAKKNVRKKTSAKPSNKDE